MIIDRPGIHKIQGVSIIWRKRPRSKQDLIAKRQTDQSFQHSVISPSKSRIVFFNKQVDIFHRFQNFRADDGIIRDATLQDSLAYPCH